MLLRDVALENILVTNYDHHLSRQFVQMPLLLAQPNNLNASISNFGGEHLPEPMP